jgi:tRNA threonylcarbamoyladenosine biosynthesis protein TsaE
MSTASAQPLPRSPQAWTGMLPDAAATRRMGLTLGKTLPPDAIVLLSGELGAGKTTLVKAACEALGIAPAVVISPTYTLVNVYPGSPPIYHVDLYRLENPDALLELDERDWINPEGPTFIEWPEATEPLLAGRSALRVELAHAGEARTIRIAANSPEYVPVFTALEKLA